MIIKKFDIKKKNKNDRNTNITLEQLAQQVYINNLEIKQKINEIIDKLNNL